MTQTSASSFACLAVKKDGKIALEDRDGYQRYLSTVGDGEELDFQIGPASRKRTLKQSAFWHAVVIPAFSGHCGYRADEMKDVLALALIPKTITRLDGTTITVPGHTSDLTVPEFNDLIERAQQLGAEMDIYIPDPDVNWRQTKREAHQAMRQRMQALTQGASDGH